MEFDENQIAAIDEFVASQVPRETARESIRAQPAEKKSTRPVGRGTPKSLSTGRINESALSQIHFNPAATSTQIPRSTQSLQPSQSKPVRKSPNGYHTDVKHLEEEVC